MPLLVISFRIFTPFSESTDATAAGTWFWKNSGKLEMIRDAGHLRTGRFGYLHIWALYIYIGICGPKRGYGFSLAVLGVNRVSI